MSEGDYELEKESTPRKSEMSIGETRRMIDAYELQKQLAIKDALLADWELKNRVLRESMTESSKLRGDLEEQLAIKKFGYDAHIKRLTEEIEHVKHFNSVLSNQKILLQENNLREQKEHEQIIFELHEKIATQDSVIEDLTDENLRLTQSIGVQERKTLQIEVDYLKNRNRVLNKLEGVLDGFEQ